MLAKGKLQFGFFYYVIYVETSRSIPEMRLIFYILRLISEICENSHVKLVHMKVSLCEDVLVGNCLCVKLSLCEGVRV